jgi:hypothetical protein
VVKVGVTVRVGVVEPLGGFGIEPLAASATAAPQFSRPAP